jgi:hypothetical protein
VPRLERADGADAVRNVDARSLDIHAPRRPISSFLDTPPDQRWSRCHRLDDVEGAHECLALAGLAGAPAFPLVLDEPSSDLRFVVDVLLT